MKNCFISGDSWKYFVLGVVILLLPLIGLGQSCIAPDPAFSTSSTDALCLGAGTVTVSNVTGGSGAYEYQLINPTNSGLNKPWQTSSTFISVSSGTYEAQVRSVCTSGTSVISSVVTQPVTVGGNYQTMELSVNTTATCTSDGTITATASKGYLTPGNSYRYALVATLNELEPVSSYVRPPQSSNVFTGLTPGTYYVRVYDDCSSYSSYKTVAANVYSSSNTNAFFYIGRNLDYCSTDYLVTNPINFPPGTFWVVYPDGTEESLRTNNLDTIPFTVDKFNTSPANFSLKFVDQCGFEKLFPYVYDSLQLNFVAEQQGAVGCDSTYYYPHLKAFSSYWPTIIQNRRPLLSYSIDNGPLRSGPSFVYFRLPNDGSPHQLVISACNLTDTVTIQAPLPPNPPTLQISEFNTWSCEGLTGFYVRSVDLSAFAVDFLSMPAGQSPVSNPFYSNANNFQNLLPGTYTFVVYNNCFRDTLSVTLSNPYQKSVELTKTLLCTGSNAYINVAIKANTYTPYGEPGQEYYKILAYNSNNVLAAQVEGWFNVTGTGGVSQFNYSFLLPVGFYKIEVQKRGLNNIWCSIETDTITTKGIQPVTLDQLLATSFCPTEGFTVVQASGGVGPYQYTLYENTIDPSNKLAGPQDGNAFTGLDPNKIYHVAATDQCGSGINIQTQFSTVPITTALNANSKDCMGGLVQIEVYSLPGATYQWYKDDVIISGATNPTYTIPALSSGDLGTYKVFVTVGSCDDFTTDLILTGTECSPFPVKLSAFSATKEGTSALLQWSTTLEDHSDRFEVQYSGDARNWVTEGSVQAKGSSTATTHYTYSHWSPQNGNNYYRLKMIDQDGSWALSSIKNVRFELASSISIYPNPAVDKIRLAGTDLKNITGIVIYDLTGRELLRPGFSDGLINVKQLAAGTYIIQVNYHNGLAASQKLVVIR